MTNEEIVALWKEKVVKNSTELDHQASGGGHIWHSLWTGFVLALDRPDLTNYQRYMELGFPAEGQSRESGDRPWEFKRPSRFDR